MKLCLYTKFPPPAEKYPPPTRRGASVPSLGSANNRLTRHNQALAQFPPTEMGHSAPASRRWQWANTR